MEEDGRLAIGLALGLDIHKGHLKLLTLTREGEDLDREGVREVGTVEVRGERALGDDAGGLRNGGAGSQEAAHNGGRKREPHDCQDVRAHDRRS